MILFGSWNVSKIAIKATVSFYCERQEKRGSLFLPLSNMAVQKQQLMQYIHVEVRYKLRLTSGYTHTH